MAVVNDATTDYRPVSINNLEMSFFFRNDDNRFEEIETIDKDNTHAKFGVRPAVVRSKQNLEREVDAGSKFYEIFNSQFDAISLRFTLDSGTCEGVLIPNWKRAQRTQDAYTYAVDLGTTNTYISCCKFGRDNEPEQLNMDEPMVAFLHDFKRSSQHSLVSVIENAIAPQMSQELQYRVRSGTYRRLDLSLPDSHRSMCAERRQKQALVVRQLQHRFLLREINGAWKPVYPH